MAINRIINLPWRLSKEQLSWLKNRAKDKRQAVRELAQEQLEMRFPSRQEPEDVEIPPVLCDTALNAKRISK